MNDMLAGNIVLLALVILVLAYLGVYAPISNQRLQQLEDYVVLLFFYSVALFAVALMFAT